MQARNEGVLMITDRCTFLAHKDGERETLAWPSDRTAWDPATATIVFRRENGDLVRMRNGDQIVMGGGGSSEREDGLTGPEWARRLNWVVPPALECLTDTRWEVGDVEPPHG
jgi:hypothetical protein